VQMTYFFFSYFRVLDKQQNQSSRIVFSVPCGAFGNLFAGEFAKQMGLPISKFIVATNANDVICRFFQTGRFEPKEVQSTLASAMDVQLPYNFERFLYFKLPVVDRVVLTHFRPEEQVFEVRNDQMECILKDILHFSSISDLEISSIMTQFIENLHYKIDPHTAVAIAAAQNAKKNHPQDEDIIVCLATADFCKFEERYNQVSQV